MPASTTASLVRLYFLTLVAFAPRSKLGAQQVELRTQHADSFLLVHLAAASTCAHMHVAGYSGYKEAALQG